MVDVVVSFAVERLGDLLIQEARLLSGVKGEVEDVQAELRQLQSFLKDAAARQSRDEAVRNWIRDAKNLSRNMEDLLEIYAIKVASKKGVKGSVRNVIRKLVCLLNDGIVLHGIGSEIAGVRNKLSNLNTSLGAYGIRSIMEGGSSSSHANDNDDGERERWRRMSYPHLVDNNFVGMEDNVKQLVSLLIDDASGGGRHLGLVAIWGMGGLGKTTLAKKVCNDVRRKFDCFAWVCLTQKCQSIRKVLQDIFEALVPGQGKEEIVKMRDQELVARLYNVQQEKKCLVVIDDIWEMDDWECLRPAFPIDQKKIGSKLLLTTRKKEVAKLGYIHELQCLSDEDGWKLLRKKAFPEEFPGN